MTKSQQKLASIEQLSTKDGVISALAFDQRGAFEKNDGRTSNRRTNC